MRAVILLAFALAFAFSLDAQITATLNPLPDGLDELRIRNNSATSLVAFVVTVKRTPRGDYSSNAPFVVYSDPLTEPSERPLLASEERVLIRTGVAPGRDPSGRLLCLGECSVLEKPIVAAGIFTDGATTGDAALLSRLILRRCNMLQAVETALETLSDAGRHNVDRGQLIGQFKKMADSFRRWYLPPEQQVGSGV